MEKLNDKMFWRFVLMRALKTFCQTLIATGGIAGVTTLADIKAIDWQYVLIASVLAAVVSLVNNLVANIPEYEGYIEGLNTPQGTPSEDVQGDTDIEV